MATVKIKTTGIPGFTVETDLSDEETQTRAQMLWEHWCSINEFAEAYWDYFLEWVREGKFLTNEYLREDRSLIPNDAKDEN